MNQFIDDAEYAVHEANQCTVEAIDFTLNALKYASKLARNESLGGLCFPLNYMMHQRLLPVYLDLEITSQNKSHLAPTFQDHFFHLQSFSQSFLGVKGAFQLLHIVRHVFTTHLIRPGSLSEGLTFASYDDKQNRALLTLKTLMQKLTKEFPTVLRQRLISVELISEKKL